jgi:hypothetical protein
VVHLVEQRHGLHLVEQRHGVHLVEQRHGVQSGVKCSRVPTHQDESVEDLCTKCYISLEIMHKIHQENVHVSINPLNVSCKHVACDK